MLAAEWSPCLDLTISPLLIKIISLLRGGIQVLLGELLAKALKLRTKSGSKALGSSKMLKIRSNSITSSRKKRIFGMHSTRPRSSPST